MTKLVILPQEVHAVRPETALSLEEITRSSANQLTWPASFKRQKIVIYSVKPLAQILQWRYLYLRMHLRVALLTFSEP